MAVDTRDKRASCLGLALSVPSLRPNPDGAMGTADRLVLLFCYAGVAAAAPAAGSVHPVGFVGANPGRLMIR